MKAWAADQKTEDSIIRMFGDPRSEVTQALGLVLDHPGPMSVLGNDRCKRFSMFIDDGIIKKINIAEAEDDPAGDSDPSATLVEQMLKDIPDLEGAADSSGSKYGLDLEGTNPSLEFRAFVKDSETNSRVSAWHGIPLTNEDGSYNFLCEIPKETKAKMEVATDEKLTPIKQDTKKGALRDYPYNIHWNYGMLPRTWEDPQHEHPTMKVKGDNDPMDVVEIGSTTLAMGSVTAVKPVGVYAMIDDGELDWKVIAISMNDPKAKDINDVADVEKHFPGELERIRVWFRDYKGPNAAKFGLDDKCMDRAYTLDVIKETATFYDDLVSGKRANDEGLALA